jgi:Tfp pilus assembly protein PilO
MSLRTTVSSTLRRPLGYFAREWGRMAPRERRLVTILGGAVGGVLVLVVGFLIVQRRTELSDGNNAAREALADIAAHRDEYLDAKARMQALEIRIGSEPPQLAADLEAAARDVGIQIPETTPRPAVPAGKRYLENTLDVTLRQVDLLSLAKFLSKVETGPRLIVISKMSVRRGFADGEKLNVTLTATAYERVKDTKKKAGGKEKT